MKKKIALIFGGRSGEHEVSLVSAQGVLANLNRNLYDILEIGITPNGDWLTGENVLEKFKTKNYQELNVFFLAKEKKSFDLAFPVMHGTFAEDGTIQGLLESFDLPYVGCGVLASAVGMDKMICKALAESAGVPVVQAFNLSRSAWEKNPQEILALIVDEIGIPCFVKPANMGSSVGVSKVKSAEDLLKAIDLACEFDRRVLVEKALRVREIECAILGNEDVFSAPLGEIIVGGEFYDFYDKYVDGRSYSEIPAQISPEHARQISDFALKIYRLLDCSGLARVDFFIDQDSSKVYFNEINTMPGFTPISMYPKMMADGGITYSALLDRLIDLAFERARDRRRNRLSFDSGSNWLT